MKRKGYRAKTIGMKLRYANFQTLTRDTTLGYAVHDTHSIRDALRSCLKRVPLDARLRLLGVGVAALASVGRGNAANSEVAQAKGGRKGSLPLFD